MKAVILCGGLGTRIREVNETLPKPMLSVGNRPVVWHVMKTYASAGVREFVLCLGYKSWMFKEWFLNYRTMTTDITVHMRHHQAVDFHGGHHEEDWSVTLAETGLYTMTGGRVQRIRRYVEDDDLFMMTYGDGVADIDIAELVRFHKSHGRVATVTAVSPPSRFGEMVLDQGRVRSFVEKPQVTEGSINGGYFVLDAKRVWDYLGDDDESLVFEREPLQRLAADDQLVAYDHKGFWQPMDTSREYNLLNRLWDAGEAPWKVW